MFKAKVYSYSNVNGKENKFEKEFDNEQDYQNFIQQNQPNLPGSMDWQNMLHFNNYLEDFFDKKMNNLFYDELDEEGLENIEDRSLVDMNKYENELEKINQQKQQVQFNKERLENTLQKLKDYKSKFKEEGKTDLVKDIENDIKKVQDELKKLN